MNKSPRVFSLAQQAVEDWAREKGALKVGESEFALSCSVPKAQVSREIETSDKPVYSKKRVRVFDEGLGRETCRWSASFEKLKRVVYHVLGERLEIIDEQVDKLRLLISLDWCLTEEGVRIRYNGLAVVALYNGDGSEDLPDPSKFIDLARVVPPESYQLDESLTISSFRHIFWGGKEWLVTEEDLGEISTRGYIFAS